jgi:hypothetical protein
MRTTVTLEPDVAQLIQALMRERGLSFKEALNLAVRRGLGPAKTSGRTPTFPMGDPAVPVTHALRLAADLEDDEIVRKLALGK